MGWMVLYAASWAGGALSCSAQESEQLFEAKIRPVLAVKCFRCHGDGKESGGLRVDSREALLKGGESGPALVPSKPGESLLIRAIERHADVSAMPPENEKALRADEVADFVAWVKAGANWPESTAKFSALTHWAFEPVRNLAAPIRRSDIWVQTSIDAFIRTRQQAAGMSPASPADKLTLIRRATFDLTGLPPTTVEVEAFENDASPDAFERVADRLLASTAYGEKWGRHWLDLVRYADTAGETADYPVPTAWRYRNYVIDAFQADKPYDEFLREQVAGDILANQGPAEKYAERVTATGYLAISRRFGFDSENYHHLTIQDTIDTLGQTVLGLSIGCARCHDHKFDPVSTKDYYALYGIFDSSRYAFPGSEQKQKVRSLVPLVPAAESLPRWREFEQRTASMSANLARQKRPVPIGVLRSLDEMDGDFELQAPAAGGSNGVLVLPWLYSGSIAVTTEAQSPFLNAYPLGRVGASIASNAGHYRIAQALRPQRSRGEPEPLQVNLDFRVAKTDEMTEGAHRLMLGPHYGTSALELLITSDTLALRMGPSVETLAKLSPGEWQNLQLRLDLQMKMVAGRVGSLESTTEFIDQPLAKEWSGAIEQVVLDSGDHEHARLPAIEYDNLAIGSAAIPTVKTKPRSGNEGIPDTAALTEQLLALVGIDGDFELQIGESPPGLPWNAGPNSVVKAAATAQSPFRNVYAPGTLGITMPNRGEYDGFGIPLPPLKPSDSGKVFASFDFCCASEEHGGNGTWRYYLGRGPGHSAAVELFFNGSEFFRRSGDVREPVASLKIGQWYQVQLELDLAAKSYTGTLCSTENRADFSGQLASGWDGTIDNTFIDSYGHVGGVRPGLFADNFALGNRELPAFDAPAKESTADVDRRTQVRALRRQIAELQTATEREANEFRSLLATGPVPLAYGVTEGTPHDTRLHLRGEPDQLGEVVPRGFVKVLGQSTLPVNAKGSGRLELAQWLTRTDNPLTARVIVNRIWQHHFGRGVVKTPSDFGSRGIPPSHPELLDHLAAEFVQSGWSIKFLHRRILQSSTYQQSPAGHRTGESDTSDLYVGFSRRRLSAEEIRDAILAVSGRLDRSPGHEHPFPSPLDWNFTQHNPFSAVYDHRQRSVYLMASRLKRHPFLALFDGSDPNASTPARAGTTVPTQALFFLNDPLVHESADDWAARLLAEPSDEAQIEQAWHEAYGRSPAPVERAEAAEFLAMYRAELLSAGSDRVRVQQLALAAFLRTIFGSNEFLHVD
jgi:hypothetical protein